MKTPVRLGSCQVASIVAPTVPPRQSISLPTIAFGGTPAAQSEAFGSTTNPSPRGLSEKTPDTASGIGPVNSFGSDGANARTAEQYPGDTPFQLMGMIESVGPVSVHSTVSPLAMVSTEGENDPSALTLTT